MKEYVQRNRKGFSVPPPENVLLNARLKDGNEVRVYFRNGKWDWDGAEPIAWRWPLRALSWKQPYAELMFHGKQETRSWYTPYRGDVLICASKDEYGLKEIESISGEKQFDRIYEVLIQNWKEDKSYVNKMLDQRGMAIAIGTLTSCKEMSKEDEDATFVKYVNPWIKNNKDKRLYCHIYSDVRPIIPFPWKGTQGWKEVSLDVVKQIQFTEELKVKLRHK